MLKFELMMRREHYPAVDRQKQDPGQRDEHIMWMISSVSVIIINIWKHKNEAIAPSGSSWRHWRALTKNR